MQDFRKLKVWQKAHQLTLSTYKITKLFPKVETYGLTSQLRRASSSVAANISEGCGRNSDGEFQHFINIAVGSASEVEYHLLLAHDLSHIPSKEYELLSSEIVEIKKMLTALRSKIALSRKLRD